MRPASKPLLAAALTLGLLLAGATPALAQYKWKDGQGQTHFSDLPPPREVPDRDVLQRPSAAARQSPAATPPASAVAGASGPAKTPTDPELETRRHRADNEARARADAERAENCRRARQQLAIFDSGRRLVVSNERGEPQVVDDRTRAAEAQFARHVVASDCH